MDTPINPTQTWTRQFGDNAYDHAEDMTVDRFGNVYLAGHSKGQMGDTHQGKDDSWLTKLDPYGNLLWIEQFGSDGHDHAAGLATDHFGFLYVSGHTTGAKVADGHKGGADAWLAKYDPDGKQIWIEQIGTEGHDAGHGIAVTSKGDIFVAGYSHGDMEESGSTSNDADAWVAKFTNDGKKLWLKHIGSRADDVAYDIAVDSFGHAYVGGYTRGSIRSNTEDRGSKQIWVIKLDDNGDQLWIREFGISGKDDEARALATDNQGNVFVTGMTYHSERGSSDTQLKRNIFITKIRGNSSIEWSKFVGGEETDIAYGIATDPLGNIFVTGYTRGEVEEGEQKGKADILVVKFDTKGEQLWMKQLGTSSEDKGESISIDSFGNIYVAGYTEGRLTQGADFGSGVDAWVTKFLGHPTEQEQFSLLSDYMQQMNSRVSRIEVGNTETHHEMPTTLVARAGKLTEGSGDGRISREDAQTLVEAAKDGGDTISTHKKMQLAYIFFAFDLTVAASDVIETAVRG